MQAIVTLCNTIQMGVEMEIIFIPLASLALCITVNILYYNMNFAERGRRPSGLTHILTWGHGGIENDSHLYELGMVLIYSQGIKISN